VRPGVQLTRAAVSGQKSVFRRFFYAFVGTYISASKDLAPRFEDEWLCRHCHRLRYDSQLDPKHFVALERMARAAEALGVCPFTAPEDVERPRYMHRDKYARLLARYEEAYDNFFTLMDAYFAASEKRIEKLSRRLTEKRSYR
jgi:hypothetical protein